jgi:hypothetical protein
MYSCSIPAQPTECKSGYWCPMGTIEPIKCHGLSLCPKGSGKEVNDLK